MKILYVEDDQAVASVAKFLFLKTDLQIVFCQTIAAAINTLTVCGQKIDLILLDLYLPDGRGVELLEKMQALGLSAPVVVTTGFYNDHKLDLKPFEEAGTVCKVMHKPFLPEALLQTLNAVEKSLAE